MKQTSIVQFTYAHILLYMFVRTSYHLYLSTCINVELVDLYPR